MKKGLVSRLSLFSLFIDKHNLFACAIVHVKRKLYREK